MTFTEISASDIVELKKLFAPRCATKIEFFESPLATKNSISYSEQFLEAVDFDLTYTPLKHFMRKVITNAYGHLLALGSKPKYVGLTIAIPNRVSKEMVTEMANACLTTCDSYDMEVAFIELRPSYGAISVFVNGFGKELEVEKSSVLEKDAIVVTGSLGAAFGGLQVLLNAKKEWENNPDEAQPDISDHEELVKAQLYPEPLFEIFEVFKEIKLYPANIRFATQGFLDTVKSFDFGGYGFEIHEETLPLTNETHRVAKIFGQNAFEYALNGGEDYQFVFVMAEKDVERVRNYMPQCRLVGYVTPHPEKKIIHNDGQIGTLS